MIIRVDSRGIGENEIYQSMVANNSTLNYTIERVPLDVGDYHILNDDGSLAVVIERKSHSDLASSIQTNNHMKEQIFRLRALKAQQPNVVVFLLYEGVLDKEWTNRSTGSMPNANVRKKRQKEMF